MAVQEIVTVSPRGFCAGVARSIKVVEDCVDIFGTPIYVKHAIVHNKTVVENLAKKGVITVEDVADIPEGAVAVFSAHGSPPEHFAQARAKNIRVIDATCPLVTKVHMEMTQFIKKGYRVIYIGHKGHVEGLGVIGEAKKCGVDVPIIESVEDVASLPYKSTEKIAFLTQTTLSVEETKAIIAALKEKYPAIVQPSLQDICYATTNRQEAIRVLAREVDVIFVVGSKTSSNSNRLVEVVRENGCKGYLIDTVEEIQPAWIADVATVGVSAGASAPEYKVQEIVDDFVHNHGATHREITVTKENMQFTEPVALTTARKECAQITEKE